MQVQKSKATMCVQFGLFEWTIRYSRRQVRTGQDRAGQSVYVYDAMKMSAVAVLGRGWSVPQANIIIYADGPAGLELETLCLCCFSPTEPLASAPLHGAAPRHLPTGGDQQVTTSPRSPPILLLLCRTGNAAGVQAAEDMLKEDGERSPGTGTSPAWARQRRLVDAYTLHHLRRYHIQLHSKLYTHNLLSPLVSQSLSLRQQSTNSTYHSSFQHALQQPTQTHKI